MNIFRQFAEFMNGMYEGKVDYYMPDKKPGDAKHNKEVLIQQRADGEGQLHLTGKYAKSLKYPNSAEEQIDEHEDKEAAFARELAALLEKYGLELQDEEEDNVEEDYENESDEERAKKDVEEDFKKKSEAKTEKEKADDDEDIEKAELRENKDEKKEYHNSSDFQYFKKQYNGTKAIKAAPSTAFMTLEEQRKLGKELY